jgi:RNA polymerase sigma factor (TIGR02999 family)
MVALKGQPDLLALMEAADGGSKPAADVLFSSLYGKLRRIAKYQLARSGSSASISATTLLHQAYIEMAGREGATFPDRGRFIGYAARVMRSLIIDHARSGRAQKRGGQFEITRFGNELESAPNCSELTRISDALEELAQAEPALAEIVDLKFFCGFSYAEIAVMKDVSERTIQRDWEKARIYLHRSFRPDLEI